MAGTKATYEQPIVDLTLLNPSFCIVALFWSITDDESAPLDYDAVLFEDANGQPVITCSVREH